MCHTPSADMSQLFRLMRHSRAHVTIRDRDPLMHPLLQPLEHQRIERRGGPIGNRVRNKSDGAAGLESARPEWITLRLHADNPYLQREGGESVGDAAHQATAANRHEDALHLRAVIEDLGDHGRVTGHDSLISVRMDERLGLLFPAAGPHPLVQHLAGHRHHLRAQRAHTVRLEFRSGIEHYDATAHPQLASDVRTREGGVPCTHGHETAAKLPWLESERGCEEAANLEAAGRLQGLQLHASARGCADQRGATDVRGYPLRDRLQSLCIERHCDSLRTWLVAIIAACDALLEST